MEYLKERRRVLPFELYTLKKNGRKTERIYVASFSDEESLLLSVRRMLRQGFRFKSSAIAVDWRRGVPVETVLY